MTDINTVLQSIAQHQSALSEVGKVNKKVIFDALAANEFTTVTVTFNGEGDSGQIEDLAAYKGDVLTKLPDLKLSVQAVGWGDKEVRTAERSFADAIEYLCYDFLEHEHGGWENNDGAFGEFTLHVADRTIDLEFNGRYTSHETTTHTF